MKLSKADKWMVICWVDRQFSSNARFPSKFIMEDDNSEERITKFHLNSWRSWRSLSNRWSDIKDWCAQNLSDQELKQMTKHVKELRKK